MPVTPANENLAANDDNSVIIFSFAIHASFIPQTRESLDWPPWNSI